MKTALMGLSGAAAAGTGATGYYLYSRNSGEETIRSKVSSLQLISSLSLSKEEMEQQWKEEFNLDKEEIKKVVTGIQEDSKGGEALSAWCNDSLSKSPTEPLLTNVKKWCVVGTIESRIGKGKQFLEESGSEWESKWSTNTDATKRQKVGLTGSKDQNNNNKDSDIGTIKKFCRDNRTKKFLAKEKTTVYDVVLEWCTK
ncbi:hypothetical protein MHF_1395 [Mycoplasma haemofelis Ohio2]|uniref:Uncharacterized protein n=1 Tax=Mycoplasma haemofelis (strain Ohio2) TaxID=859194 RepID=F6FGJ3_MYCHI|nr:hypothetical protein MHF_1395 [Mycoplasma haemofelis Ohio2]